MHDIWRAVGRLEAAIEAMQRDIVDLKTDRAPQPKSTLDYIQYIAAFVLIGGVLLGKLPAADVVEFLHKWRGG